MKITLVSDVQHNKRNDTVDLLKLCATLLMYFCQKDAISSDWVKIPDKSILRRHFTR